MNKKEEYEKLISELDIDYSELTDRLVNFIRKKADELNREGLVLGLSGGVDSAVVAKLCKLAKGKEKTTALIMPEKDSLKKDETDAAHLAEELGINKKIIVLTPLLKKLNVYRLYFLNKIPVINQTKRAKSLINKIVNKLYKLFTKKTPFSDNLLGTKDKKFHKSLNKTEAYYRIKHRMRMVLLYFHGEVENDLVVGAANKSEHLTGYFVKHGCDDASDIMPIMGLYKTQVIKLAEYLNIPKKILKKKPSGGTMVGVSDEQALGLSYRELDLILLALEKKWSVRKIAKVLNQKEEKVQYVNSLIKNSEHMRKNYVPDDIIKKK